MFGLFGKKVPKEESELGQVLVKMGAVKMEQLSAAEEEREKNPDTRLGSILVRMGAITQAQLDRALAIQKRLRKGDRVGAMLDLVEGQSNETLGLVVARARTRH